MHLVTPRQIEEMYPVKDSEVLISVDKQKFWPMQNFKANIRPILHQYYTRIIDELFHKHEKSIKRVYLLPLKLILARIHT